MKASDFYTVPKSEAGVKLELQLPDGKDSGAWLLIKGPDSKAFVKAAGEFNRALAKFKTGLNGGPPTDEQESEAETLTVNYASQLVIGWNFEDEFTLDAVKEFLRNSPAIAQKIPELAVNRNRFLGQVSPPSTPGPTNQDDLASTEVPSEPQSA